MSSVTRSLTDPIKLGLMWILGKFFWFSGEAIWGTAWGKDSGIWFVLAEPWEPHSYLMIPGLMLIGYAMLMFKNRVYLPIKFARDENGKYGIQFYKAKKTEEEKENPYLVVNAGMDDGFYAEAFANKKIRNAQRRALADALQAPAQGNRFQSAWARLQKM